MGSTDASHVVRVARRADESDERENGLEEVPIAARVITQSLSPKSLEHTSSCNDGEIPVYGSFNR